MNAASPKRSMPDDAVILQVKSFNACSQIKAFGKLRAEDSLMIATDWGRDIAPKMKKAIQLLEDASIEKSLKADVAQSVRHIFTVQPRSIGSKLNSVWMQDEMVGNFKLEEWLVLNQDFKKIEQKLFN